MEMQTNKFAINCYQCQFLETIYKCTGTSRLAVQLLTVIRFMFFIFVCVYVAA